MSNLAESFSSFYKLASSLEASSKPVTQKRQKLEQLVVDFKTKLEQIGEEFCATFGVDNTKQSAKDTQDSQEMSELASVQLQGMQDKVKCWLDEFEAQAKRERFEAQFENSFIIMIYGKVKAGKSSLSNFVARHCLPEQEVRFYCYERANQTETESSATEMRERAFKVDIIECTAEIQYFTLGSKGAGQTEGKIIWVDTPGLASTTDAYGELAKKYIQSAHYIIVPLSSSEPLTQDEQKEIEDLINCGGKADNIRLLITKSDEIIKDENEQKQVVKVFKNKSEDTRKQQESATLKTLQDLGIKLHHKPLSISVKSAEFALGESQVSTKESAKEEYVLQESEESLFDGSNMGEFYNSLATDLQKRAKDLAQNAPANTLKALIGNLLRGKDTKDTQGEKETQEASSLEALKKDYHNVVDLAKRKKEETENAKIDLENDMSIYIEGRFETYREKLQDLPSGGVSEKFKKAFEKFFLKSKWSQDYSKQKEIITPDSATTKAELFNALASDIISYAHREITQRMQEIFRDFQNRLEINLPEVETKTTRAIAIERNIFERFINTITFDWLFQQEYEHKDITQEAINVNKEKLRASCREMIDGAMERMQTQLFEPYQILCEKLQEALDSLERKLLDIQKSL